jgi:hypothetical protein
MPISEICLYALLALPRTTPTAIPRSNFRFPRQSESIACRCFDTSLNDRQQTLYLHPRCLIALVSSPPTRSFRWAENINAGMMNGRHLPAGQGMQQDMGRRRSYNHQQYQPVTPVYNGYMNPYNNFYPQVPPQYQHGSIPPAQYPPYPSYGRSPPPQFQQYAHTPPPIVTSYPRPQQSPAVVSTPYQTPPPQPSVSSQSSHTMSGPMTAPVLPAPQPVKITRPPFYPPVSLQNIC